MTTRTVIQCLLSILGVGLILALLKSEAGLAGQGGYYALAILLALAGAIPREISYLITACGLAVAGYVLFTGNAAIFGFGLAHAFVCVAIATGLYILSMPTETKVFKCRICYWRGPGTKIHFHKCPKCGSKQVQDTHQTVLTHA